MKKEQRIQFEDWKEFSIAIRKIYEKLAKLEIDDKIDSNDYNELLEVLSIAIEFQNKRIKNLNINRYNYEQFRKLLSHNIERVQADVFNNKSSETEKLRMYNEFEGYLLAHNMFYERPEIRNPFEAISVAKTENDINELRYASYLSNEILMNFISIIDRYAEQARTKGERDYLISLKYKLIYTNPDYEFWFVKNNGRLLPTHDINRHIPFFKNMDKEDLMQANEYYIVDYILGDLKSLYKLSNEELKNPKLKYMLYRIVPSNTARLISTLDVTLVVRLWATIQPFLIQDEEHYKINEYIMKIFADSTILIMDTLEEKKIQL